MADVHLFSGDSASDEDFQSENMAKWNRKVQEKFEKEKKQIRRKRKNPLSTQAPNPKIPSKASSPSSGGGVFINSLDLCFRTCIDIYDVKLDINYD